MGTRCSRQRRRLNRREDHEDAAGEESDVALLSARRVMPITRPEPEPDDAGWRGTGTPDVSDASPSLSAPPKRETETTTPRRTLPLSVTSSALVAAVFFVPFGAAAEGLARLRGGGLMLSADVLGDVAEEDAPDDWGESPEVEEDAYLKIGRAHV